MFSGVYYAQKLGAAMEKIYLKLPLEAGQISTEQTASGALRALKPIAEIAVLFSALAFAGGWSYFASYYYHFGLNPLELSDVPVAFSSVFSLQVLYKSAWPVLAVVLASCIYAVLRRLPRFNAVRGEQWAPVLLLAAFLAAGLLGLASGASRARSDLFDETSGLPTVGFVTDLTGDLPDCAVHGTTDCRLVAHLKGVYYLLDPVHGDPKIKEIRNFDLYAVPESHVKSFHIVRGFR